MTKTIAALALLAALILPTSALAERATTQSALVSTVMTTGGGEVTSTITHVGSSRGYLVVKTSAEVTCTDLFDTPACPTTPQTSGSPDGNCDSSCNAVSSASLAVIAKQNDALSGNVALCTMTAITANGTTVALLGSDVAAGEGITDVCDFPLAESTLLSFTVTGEDAGFTTQADMIWLPE